MTDLVPWYSIEQDPGRASYRGYCGYRIERPEGGASCHHRTKRMGSVQKAETAIQDHLRDVHGVDPVSPSAEWAPDGHGLPEEARVEGAMVHLRLSARGYYPRTACAGGLGERWTGVLDEVTCKACLAVAP